MYQATEFFMVRVPLLDLNEFDNFLQSGEDILVYLKKQRYYSQFKEALFIASKSLFDSYILFEDNKLIESKKIRNLKLGVLKYFLRAVSRGTPFGCFSSVSTGYVKPKTSLQAIESSILEKSVRPDMELINLVLKDIEKEAVNLEQVTIMFNSSVYFDEYRAYLPYRTNDKKNDVFLKNENISIKKNELLDFVFINSRNQILISTLIEIIKKNYNLSETENIKLYIQGLIDNGFLITEFKPLLNNTNLFLDLINKVKKYDKLSEYYNFLEQLNQKLMIYEKKTVGTGLSNLQDIYLFVNNRYRTNDPIQVDTFFKSNNQISLSNKLAEDLENCASFLYYMSIQKRGLINIREYHTEFLEKFGIAREIPLLDLINEDTGLGFPAGYEEPKSNRVLKSSLKSNEKKITYIRNKIYLALLEKQKSIVIEDDILLSMKKDVDENLIADSIELFFHIINFEQNNQPQILLAFNQGTQCAGSTFGRFSHILENKSENFENVASLIQDNYPDKIFCELIFTSTSPRNSNVCIVKSNWKHKIFLDTIPDDENIITLDDVLVCSNHEQLYFKSKRHKKEIVFMSSHLLNYEKCPNLIRFMRELSLEGYTPWNIFSLEELGLAAYAPRVIYKNIILLPATWRLTIVDINNDLIKNEEEFKNYFNSWRLKWSVPKVVLISSFDNRIPVDLDDLLILKDIWNTISKNKEVIFKEYLFKCKENTYEFVLPLIRKTFPKNVNKMMFSKPPILDTNRIHLPGSNWFYAKIYVSKSKEYFFLNSILNELIQNVYKSADIDKWFYIRYEDPLPHIRLRFLIAKNYDKNNLKILKTIREYSEFLVEKKLIIKLQIDSYEPEIERYGGPGILNLAESVFHFESELILKIIHIQDNLKNHFPLEVISALLIINILDAFDFSLDNQCIFMQSICKKEEVSKDFRKYKNVINNIFLLHKNNWYEDEIFNEIKINILNRFYILKKYKDMLVLNFINNNLHNTKYNIINSLIHMQCNRLFGVNRILEDKSCSFALNILYSIKYISNHSSESI